MLQINAPVLLANGSTIATGTIVTWTPMFGAGRINPDTSRTFPVKLDFHTSLANLQAGYDPTPAVKDAVVKEKIIVIEVDLTIAESVNPSQSIIEGHLKTYLETIYGVGNVVII